MSLLGCVMFDGRMLMINKYFIYVCSSQAQKSLLAAEEATALSIWAVACMCGTLRLEHVGSVLAYDFMKSMFLCHILLLFINIMHG